MVNGINLPSIAGVLGFKDFTDQLNNANAGMRNVFRISKDTVSTALLHFAKPGDTVLVKASRGAHFENIVDELGNANLTK